MIPRTAVGRQRLLTLVLAIVLLVLLLPYVWLILTSLKSRNDIFSGDVFGGFAPTLENFRMAFIQKGFAKNLLNSTIVAAAAMAIAMAVGVPAGFALSRTTGRMSTGLLFVMLAARLMPVVVLAVPLFVIMANVGLVGTYAGPVIAHLTFLVPFVVWMMRGFFLAVPRELDEAALMDGATRARYFFTLLLPMTRGPLAATAIFALINSWNELLYGLILTNKATATLPVATPSLMTPIGTFWGQIAAVGVVTTLPVLIFALLVQRHIVRGMTGGALSDG
ncbi:MAG: carbohydrate ABC transporter permease [Candidatus Limnocylindrales bacterium]